MRITCVIAFWLAGVGLAIAKLSPQDQAKLPPPAKRTVDFTKDIKPIFEASCVQCHARGKDKGGFSLETREAFLNGGDSGVVAEIGRSQTSLMIETVSGLNKENVMPQKGKKLTSEQVAILRAWVDQGMVWPKEVNFFREEPANLKAHSVKEPAKKKGLENPVDRFVDAYFTQHKVKWPTVVDDRTFARRVWLDAIGLTPPPTELEAFLADKSPDKREQLVKRLLANDQAYADHWLTFWNDLLRNDYKGAGYIDGGRKQITIWLYTALARNLSYDKFVGQLINPTPESEGFTKGIIWRGAVNASMVPPMQAAHSISQVFLGVNLKCASCHDSFVNEYTLKDAYGMASIYADGPMEIAECDKLTGRKAQVRFLYEQLGAIDGSATPTARKAQLADVLTSKSNGRVTRTIVNRFWHRFMGHGLVESVDEMDKRAWSQDLLDWLAEDLAAHGYDLKHTMAQILTSRAYQLPGVSLPEKVDDYVFHGPAIRRLSAEQFCDNLMGLAELNYPRPEIAMNRMIIFQDTRLNLPLKPKWIWNAPGAEAKAKPASVRFRHNLNLTELPTEATLAIAADDRFTLDINGKRVGQTRDNFYPDHYDIKPHLKVGENLFTVTVVNNQSNGRVPKASEHTPASDNPAGLLAYVRVRIGEQVLDFVTDSSWQYYKSPEEADGGPKGWVSAVELGGVELAPWKLGNKFMETAAAQKDTRPVRASLVVSDPLMVALGRPSREQVTTVRQSTATTLQALELTNGGTLAKLLKQAGEKLLADKPADSSKLVDSLYLKAFSRKPTAREQQLAMELTGAPVTAAGVEDLLWTLAMSPEFQLVY